jgi:hypothetical protein
MTDENYDKQFGQENQPEYIICAAIWFKDGKFREHQPRNVDSGFVICGRRHHNCFTTASLLYKNMDDALLNYSEVKGTAEQGFLTSKDRFVNRDEAAEIAYSQNQTFERKKILFSEDLY